MPDWSSLLEQTKESEAYSRLIFACFGLYVWEVFQTSDFELSILQGRRKLRWEWVLFFFLCRYCLVFSLAALMASSTVKTKIDCQALYTFICWAGNMSIICASTTLMLRTIAVWERKLPVVVPLVVLCVAHWALLYRGMFLITAQYDPVKQACVVATTKRLFLSTTYFGTMGFNLVIMVVHIVGLLRRDHSASVWELLFNDGVICYLIAFSGNALPAVSPCSRVLVCLLLLRSFGTCINHPACYSAVAACRIITHCADPDDDDDIYVHSATQLTPPRIQNAAALRFTNNRYPPRPEVHVTTDHIVMEDFDPSPSSGNDKAPSLTGMEDNKSCNAV
ncbi:hypothetical protein C8Q74DRAFT_1201136 [Fomes fomentarius]|nr:hypothetical protein C8Q74DRAFT_1201136 [Fomes fomentarius]